jgi:hypothetical protein
LGRMGLFDAAPRWVALGGLRWVAGVGAAEWGLGGLGYRPVSVRCIGISRMMIVAVTRHRSRSFTLSALCMAVKA